jgi:ATP-dependent Clp protease ATP-binding subunit ClpA
MNQLQQFFEWYIERAFIAQLYFISNFVRSIEDIIGIRVNIRFYFSPIFGDKSWVGRLLTFFIRTIIILAGLLIIGAISIILLGIPFLWFFGIFLAYKYPALAIIPILGIVYYLLQSTKNPKHLYPKNISIDHLMDFSDQDTRKLLTSYPDPSFYTILEKNIYVYQFKERLLIPNLNISSKISNLNQKDINLLLTTLQLFSQNHKVRYFRPVHIFYCILTMYKNELSQELLDNKLDQELLDKYISWEEYEFTQINPPKFWDKDYKIHTGGGSNRTWQGTVTPILNQFSIDITAHSQAPYKQVYRQELIGQVEEVLNKSENANVLLVGDIGVGKETLVKQIANLINYGEVNGPLWSKRLVELDIGQLFSGTGERGAFEGKVEAVLTEITRSGNIILYLNDFKAALETTTPQGLSLFSLLQNPISQNKLHLIGSISPKEFKSMEMSNNGFLSQFSVVHVPETTKAETSHILHTECIKLEEKNNLFFPYPTIDTIVNYSITYIHDSALPQKAINLLDQIVVHAKHNNLQPTFKTFHGMKIPVTEEVIDEVIGQMTNIPVGPAKKQEAENLLHLEEKFQQHIIDQSDAVKAIAEVIRRNRSGIRNQSKPIGSFLFVGPTGVGKTETAKTVAEVYFGGKDTMIRLDMSEYQTTESIGRLIGSSQNSDSISSLTERVRKKPFSLVLLDELEKAHPQVLDLFLQVLDDARLTDTNGNTVDFTETIIVATSNAATEEITKLFNSVNSDSQYEDLYRHAYELLKPYYRVEFLNRFDQIIVFKPLTPRSIEKIVRLQLSRLATQLYETKKISIIFKDETVRDLINTGYNKDLGARPLAREIQNKVESKLAVMLLDGSLKEGQVKEI